MTWNCAYTPQIWPSLLTALLLLALAIYSGRRRSVPGALPLAVGSLLGALMAATFAAQYAAVDVATKIFWVQVRTACELPALTAITCFVLEYTWPGRWLTRRSLALLSIVPLLTVGLILTNDLHHLVWRSFLFDGAPTEVLGPADSFLIAYAYGLAVANFVVFAWLFVRSPQHRWPVVVMLIGQLGTRTLYVLQMVGAVHSDLPLPILALAFAFLTYAIVLFHFRILDPIPLARQTAIEQLHAGMLVLDPQGQVVSLNPAAERMLGAPAGRLKGRPIRELLPACPDEDQPDPGETAIEFSLGVGQKIRHYTLAVSLLKDWRGLEAGRLLLLRDTTVQKRAREMEQQQQLLVAIVQERERLARELHDSLGQTLAAAHLQASSARLLLARGQTAQTDECLERLASMTIDAEADVREYLLGAKTALSAELSFFPALRQYLRRFSQQYELPVELAAPPQLEAQGLERAVEVQLLRIIQEALSNVRKHARAHRAEVRFSVSGTLVQIAIVDDGQGFDPVALAARQGDGFGLQSMRERAEALGGRLEVISRPGQGTWVEVHVLAGARWGDT